MHIYIYIYTYICMVILIFVYYILLLIIPLGHHRRHPRPPDGAPSPRRNSRKMTYAQSAY